MSLEPGDAFGWMVLTKAVDWLFKEASQLMEERRKRRQSGDVQHLDGGGPRTALSEVSTWRPNEVIYLNHKVRIQRILELIEIQTNNRDRCQRQVQLQGGKAVASAQALAALDAAEGELLELAQQLKEILERVYQRHIDL